MSRNQSILYFLTIGLEVFGLLTDKSHAEVLYFIWDPLILLVYSDGGLLSEPSEEKRAFCLPLMASNYPDQFYLPLFPISTAQFLSNEL